MRAIIRGSVVKLSFPPLVKGKSFQITLHARPELVEDSLACDASDPFVVLPFAEEKPPVSFRGVHGHFWPGSQLHFSNGSVSWVRARGLRVGCLNVKGEELEGDGQVSLSWDCVVAVRGGASNRGIGRCGIGLGWHFGLIF